MKIKQQYAPIGEFSNEGVAHDEHVALTGRVLKLLHKQLANRVKQSGHLGRRQKNNENTREKDSNPIYAFEKVMLMIRV